MRNMPVEDETKTLVLDTGLTVYFRKDVRYGIWFIQYSNGAPPGELQGRYMTYLEAKRAFDRYLSTRRRGKNILEEGKQPRKYKGKVNEVRKEMGLEEK